MMWNPEKYIKAWHFASVAHNGQMVPGTDIPYINHIGLVAMEAMSVITYNSTIEKPDLLIQCALLHDAIEDTNCTYHVLRAEFGAQVADGVLALSKDPNLPSKKEQMQDSLLRIVKQPLEVWMVKLSDRITNLQPPPRHWSKEKTRIYRSEAISILEQLGNANRYLAERLKTKIAEYEQYQ
jgi:(p)ppGpp synthase/HD superfamily hydrolase